MDCSTMEPYQRSQSFIEEEEYGQTDSPKEERSADQETDQLGSQPAGAGGGLVASVRNSASFKTFSRQQDSDASTVDAAPASSKSPSCQRQLPFNLPIWHAPQVAAEAGNEESDLKILEPRSPSEDENKPNNETTQTGLTGNGIGIGGNDPAVVSGLGASPDPRDIWRLRSSFEDELDDENGEAADQDATESEDSGECSGRQRGQLRLLQRDSGYRSVELRCCLPTTSNERENVFDDDIGNEDENDETPSGGENFMGSFYGCHENPLVARFLRTQVSSASAASLPAASAESRRRRLRRDYSIDERSSALFNQFLRPPASGSIRRHESERGLHRQKHQQKQQNQLLSQPQTPLQLIRCSAKDSIDEEDIPASPNR